jgi:hypothetical protein
VRDGKQIGLWQPNLPIARLRANEIRRIEFLPNGNEIGLLGVWRHEESQGLEYQVWDRQRDEVRLAEKGPDFGNRVNPSLGASPAARLVAFAHPTRKLGL